MEFKFKESKLKNGLTLIEVPKEVPSVMVMAMVRAGSRDEKEGQFGAAHFLEHFVFKGTGKYPQVNQIAKEIDSLGGEQNAFTWSDYTGFWVRLAEEHWRKGVEVVGQMVSEPLLPQEQLEKEKGTIIEEIRMYEDDPKVQAWFGMKETLFAGSALGRPILGREETVEKIEVEDLEAFRDSWYWPENMMVMLLGSLPGREKIKEAIEEEFKSLAESRRGERVGYGKSFKQDKPKVKLIKKETQQAHLVLGMEGLAFEDERIYTLQVLNEILGANMSSRLFNEIREKRGLAYYIKSGFDGMTDIGSVYVQAGVRLDKAEEAVKVIKEELVKLAEEEVEEEFKRGIEGSKGGLKLALESSQKTARKVGNSWALLGKIREPEEIIEGLDQVERGDIQRVAGQILRPEKMNLSVVGPFESEERFKKVLG